jgi:hypothetical protein
LDNEIIVDLSEESPCNNLHPYADKADTLLCRKQIIARKIRIGFCWKELLECTVIEIFLLGLVIC